MCVGDVVMIVYVMFVVRCIECLHEVKNENYECYVSTNLPCIHRGAVEENYAV